MSDTQFPFVVRAPEMTNQGTFTATVRIDVEPKTQSKALGYIRSIALKNDFMNNWVKNNAPGYGLEIRGGPRPVFKDGSNRDGGVVAYEQDFRLTRPL